MSVYNFGSSLNLEASIPQSTRVYEGIDISDSDMNLSNATAISLKEQNANHAPSTSPTYVSQI